MRHVIVQELDFVRDLTVVDVRYRVPTEPRPCRRGEVNGTAGMNRPALPNTLNGLSQNGAGQNHLCSDDSHRGRVTPCPPRGR